MEIREGLKKIFCLIIISLLFTSIFSTIKPAFTYPTTRIVELEVFKDGIAKWTTEVAYTGSYSVKLLIPEGASDSSWAIVKVPYGNSLDSLKQFSFCVKYVAARPRFAVYLDKDRNGSVDSLLLSDFLDFGNGEWIIGVGGLRWGWTEATYPPYNYGKVWQPYEYWQKVYGDAVVLYVAAALEYWAAEPEGIGEHLYVDTVTINTITYDLEPTLPPPTSVGGEGVIIINTITYDLEPAPPPENRPPICYIRLQKNGVEIYKINVGEFFDIYVGDSTDDTGIVQVHFSSDDSQDGVSTGEWTRWYDWDISSEDWDASTKIKRRSFATDGNKEVWAEVKDDAGQTTRCSVDIYAIDPPALPVVWIEVYDTGSNLAIHKTHTVVGEVLKRVPDRWIVKVIDMHGNAAVADGYTWWEVEDVI